jgi:2-haloacid dehalogenase/putative hydrolase of the HAD superfamily
MKLSDFKILTFDVYGTLIDWEAGMIAGTKTLAARADRELSHDDILEAHAYHESTNQRWTPAKSYSALLAVVYRRLAEDWGLRVTWDDCEAYGASVGDWPAFPDSQASLAYLQDHFQLAVLTNTDNTSFAGSNARLGITFDAVFTAEDIGSYKPADRNFEYMLETLAQRGITPDQILHTAESQFHDHVPANRHGLKNAWIYRRHDKSGFGATMNPGATPRFDFRFNSMAEMVEAHKAEIDA